ncbi:MAG: rhodanese-like domain-containing protein [Alphaproteobacteria bacterium]|nr:rhodanese-like domain-containing protein [Alphaproteobacteria bacterium]
MIKSFFNIFADKNTAKEESQLSAQQLKDLMENSKIKVIPLDVRSKIEYDRYHIKGALNIHIVDLSMQSLQKALNLKENEKIIIVTYCNAGGRGGRSFSFLTNENTNENIQIKNLTNGINQWIDNGFPIEENVKS